MKKGIARVILAFILVMVLFALLFIALFWGFWESSGYANCVVVTNETDYIGERLRYSHAESHEASSVDECVTLDKQQDGGDGPLHGKVRWAECFKGPDCDEAGMY